MVLDAANVPAESFIFHGEDEFGHLCFFSSASLLKKLNRMILKF